MTLGCRRRILGTVSSEPETRYAKSGDVYIAYQTLGTGPLDLVVVQGFTSHLAAMAGPGEVLVSSTVKDLVTGSGLGFAERGSHVLRGVPGEWRLYAAAR